MSNETSVVRSVGPCIQEEETHCKCPKCESELARERKFSEAHTGSWNEHTEITCNCGYYSSTFDI